MMKLLLAPWLILISVVAVADPGGGQATGNGGDSIAMEFNAIGEVIAKTLETTPVLAGKFPEVNPADLRAVLPTVIVRGVDEILCDQLGNEKTAINYVEGGKKYIKVRRAEYNALPTLLRQRLVFHEYLGVMGLEKSDDYRISSRLDTVLSRPMYGSCEAVKKVKGVRHTCIVGFRFDPATRSLDGAYTCRELGRRDKDTNLFDGSLMANGPLRPEKAGWKSVRIWPGAGSYSAGFWYADEWIRFEVSSSPFPGLRLPFTLTKRDVHLSKPDTEVTQEGSCILNYD